MSVEGTDATTYEDVRFAKVAVVAAGAGAAEVIAASPGRRIKVLSYVVVASTAASLKWQSGSGGGATDLSGPMPFSANGGATPSGGTPQVPLLQTAVGEALGLHASAAVNVGGHVTYIEE